MDRHEVKKNKEDNRQQKELNIQEDKVGKVKACHCGKEQQPPLYPLYKHNEWETSLYDERCKPE